MSTVVYLLSLPGIYMDKYVHAGQPSCPQPLTIDELRLCLDHRKAVPSSDPLLGNQNRQ